MKIQLEPPRAPCQGAQSLSSQAIDFYVWLLNNLQRSLVRHRSNRGRGLNIIQNTFQGEVEVTSLAAGAGSESTPTIKRVPFSFLSLDLPATPLFKDEHEKNIIPQISL